jgi:hypothetical protein
MNSLSIIFNNAVEVKTELIPEKKNMANVGIIDKNIL